MNDRDAAIARIRAALKKRSGKAWSVTGGRGTAWGWISIESPPARRTWGERLKVGATTAGAEFLGPITLDRPEDYERFDTGKPGGSNSPAEMAELAALLGLDSVHHQGVSIAASSDYRQEYIDRAEGRTPSVIGSPYWD